MKYCLPLVLTLCVFLLFSCEKDIEQISEEKTAKLSYQVKEYYNFQGECDSLESGCVYVKFTYPEFDTTNNLVADSLNKYVNYALLASYELEMYESFDAIAKNIFDDYNSVKADFADYNHTWALEKTIEFRKSVNKNIAALHYTEYSYMGGAHPNSAFEYYNFDAVSGKRLSINDLVVPEKETTLLNLGEKKFRELKNIPDGQNLESAGYWFENNKFYLAENFTVTDSGLVFLYNPYEIAAYAEGITELFIPNNELEGILK